MHLKRSLPILLPSPTSEAQPCKFSSLLCQKQNAIFPEAWQTGCDILKGPKLHKQEYMGKGCYSRAPKCQVKLLLPECTCQSWWSTGNMLTSPHSQMSVGLLCMDTTITTSPPSITADTCIMLGDVLTHFQLLCTQVCWWSKLESSDVVKPVCSASSLSLHQPLYPSIPFSQSSPSSYLALYPSAPHNLWKLKLFYQPST